MSPSHGRNRHQTTSPREFPGNRSNRARSQRLATANAVTFSRSNSLTALFTVISTFRFRCIATLCLRNQKRASTIPISETLSFGFGSAARTTTVASEITRLRAKLRRGSARVNAGKTPQVFVAKKSRRFKFDEVRQRFRLTPTERRVVVFVAAAFVLGLVTKCYRDAHPSPTPVQTHSGRARASASSRAKPDQPGAMKTGEAAGRTRKSAEKLDLSDSGTQQEHQQK